MQTSHQLLLTHVLSSSTVAGTLPETTHGAWLVPWMPTSSETLAKHHVYINMRNKVEKNPKRQDLQVH